MKAALLLGLWLAVGVYVATRGPRPAADRAMAVLFWPFFLGQRRPGALDRLRAALGVGPAADALVAELAAALHRMTTRLDRVEAALGGLAADGATAHALLLAERDRLRGDIARAQAAIDEAAARLLVLDREGERAEVEALLGALRARLLADEEVGGAALRT